MLEGHQNRTRDREIEEESTTKDVALRHTPHKETMSESSDRTTKHKGKKKNFEKKKKKKV